jgi:hypothetical protein
LREPEQDDYQLDAQDETGQEVRHAMMMVPAATAVNGSGGWCGPATGIERSGDCVEAHFFTARLMMMVRASGSPMVQNWWTPPSTGQSK